MLTRLRWSTRGGRRKAGRDEFLAGVAATGEKKLMRALLRVGLGSNHWRRSTKSTTGSFPDTVARRERHGGHVGARRRARGRSGSHGFRTGERGGGPGEGEMEGGRSPGLHGARRRQESSQAAAWRACHGRRRAACLAR